ncbi:hypothetical protein SO802_019802, partial [Lithocarpus litseifolius]
GMDSDFIERIQNITLTEEEGEVINVGGTHRDKILEECSLSLLGRFLTTRSYNQGAAKSLIRSVWKMGSDLKIVDVGNGLFQFKFALESQLKWVIHNGPWSFENHPLVLRRMRVEIPLDKPLRRSGLVANPEGDKVCVGFKYERLVGFCYQCGKIGHEAKECFYSREQNQCGYLYGEWLKAGFRWPARNSERRDEQPPHRDAGDEGDHGARSLSLTTQPPASDAGSSPAGTESTQGYVTNLSKLLETIITDKDNHAATAVLMDTLISGFTSSQKETDLTNNEGDVSMITISQETDALKTPQLCEMENLISVPVDYVSVGLNQSTIIKQPRGVARETQQTQS